MTSSPSPLVGTCGFAEAQDKIFEDFDILEVQKTFYQPPKVETAQRWRRKAPSDFVFTVKAWQLITHESSSPTYRRLTESLSDTQLDQCGRFRWNDTTQMAWQRTQKIADVLDALAILLQTPKSFKPTSENLSHVRTFLSESAPRERAVVFEPRGSAWTDDVLRELVGELGVVHGVDPFLRTPVSSGLQYYRLHGRPEYTYGYTYDDDDFDALRTMISQDAPTWIFFNNRTMADDARRLKNQLRGDSR